MGTVPPPGGLQGLRHPGPLRRADRRRWREAIARAFARVLGELAGKATTELRVGLGRDMRLSAPELAARYREGLAAKACTCSTPGRSGSEMLYFLVGSRELDGGLMCTASHNPKPYTGAKLMREGALALSGEQGIEDVRREVEAEAQHGAGARALGPGEPAGRGSRRWTSTTEFQAAVLGFIDADAVRAAQGERALKVVLDGANGMAGPMVGPVLARLGLELLENYWTPDGYFPDHEPNPLLEENRRFIDREGARERSRPRHRLGRGRRPLLLHRRNRRVRGRRLPHRAARGLAAAQRTRARRSCTTCAPRGRSRTPCARAGGTRTSTASATRSSSRACAGRARCSAARSRATTTSATSTARTRARSPRC